MITIDGGGLRCMIVVKVLEKVEDSIRKALKEIKNIDDADTMDVLLADYFTAFSGVNCGAWIASYLASKCGKFRCKEVLSTRAVVDKYGIVPPGSVLGLRVFFEVFATTIYPQRGPRSLGRIYRIVRDRQCLVGALCPLHPVDGYHRVLEKFLGNMVMTNLPATLILPMYDLKRRAVVTLASDNMEKNISKQQLTYIFEGTVHPLDPTSLELVENRGFELYKNRSYSLLDVTQAAGTRVASHEAHRFTALNEAGFELVCQDTSLLFNNPAVVALTVMSKMRHRGPFDENTFRRISLLSIGTGMVDGSLAERAAAGALQWNIFSQDFFSVVIHGGSELVQTQVDAFLYAVAGSQFFATHGYYHFGQYLRIQSLASAGTPMGEALMASDNITYVELLKQIGEDTTFRYKETIDDFVKTFIFGVGYYKRRLNEHIMLDDWDEVASIIASLDEA